MARAPRHQLLLGNRIHKEDGRDLAQAVLRQAGKNGCDLRLNLAPDLGEVGLSLVRDEEARREMERWAEHLAKTIFRTALQGIGRTLAINAAMDDQRFALVLLGYRFHVAPRARV